MNLPPAVLAVVFLLIALRQVGGVRLQIWQIMTGGALAVVVLGQITPADALRAVNADVMLFLFGVFLLGQALEESGYLAHASYKWLKRAHTRDRLLLMLILGAGAASALLMNDTLAIVGTPVMLLVARKHGMSPGLLLLALAFSVTFGSVASPIGNPQNLLIALEGELENPFGTFLLWLGVPTVVCLGLTFLVLRKLYADDFHDVPLRHSQEPIRNHHLALLSRISLNILVVLAVVKIVLSVLGWGDEFRLTHIALGACLPVLVGSPLRWRLLRHMDWPTLAFFAAMFILMQAVWDSGAIQQVMATMEPDLASPLAVLAISVCLSQLISNVPLVALYVPLLTAAGGSTDALMALAAGSTIAGNVFILGAASNVIIIRQAERRAKTTVGLLEFARAGVPLTLAAALVYWLWLTFLAWTFR